MKILIIDDNIEMRRLIKTLVGKMADAVYECDDGRNALREYEKHRPDFVLMDIELGEKDGISATSDIVNSFPEAQVIVVTNHDDVNYRAAAFAAGAREYVVKDNLVQLRKLLIEADEKGTL